MKQKTLQFSLTAVLGLCAMHTHAATLNYGDQLTINSGTYSYDSSGYTNNVISGSYFGCDCNGNGIISGTEKTALQQGTEGLIIGVIQGPGSPSHVGEPLPTDWSRITAPYSLFGSTGQEYTTSAITGSTETGLDFSGFSWSWAGVDHISFGSGAWGAGFTNGIANFVWDGVYGHAYTLEYTTTIAPGDPSGLGGFIFKYHLEGNVNAVPVPAAAWLFGSGLLGLLGVINIRTSGKQQ